MTSSSLAVTWSSRARLRAASAMSLDCTTSCSESPAGRMNDATARSTTASVSPSMRVRVSAMARSASAISPSAAATA